MRERENVGERSVTKHTFAITGSIGGLKPAAAYVALVREFERRGLRRRVVAYAGSSGSAPWAALAARGLPAADMERALLGITSRAVWEDWNRRRVYTALFRSLWKRKFLPGFTGILEGGKIREWVRRHIGRVTFEDLSTALYIPAWNINCGVTTMMGPQLTPEPVEVAQAVRASTAIPFGFRHETIVGAQAGVRRPCGYWDGGVGCALPLLSLLHDNPHPRPADGSRDSVYADVVIALDAADVTKPPQRQPWVSIDDLGAVELLERAVEYVVDVGNHWAMRWALSRAAENRAQLFVYSVRHGASMSDPGGTIPPAYDFACEDVPRFVDRVLDYVSHT